MINRRNFCFALGAAALLHRGSRRAIEPELFTAETFRNSRNQTMPYRLFVPSAYDKRSEYPLVLWLCGGAGRGSNNRNQISLGNVLGAHVWTTPENQTKRPCFVIAPPFRRHGVASALLDRVLADASNRGASWIEAATPERPFVADIERRPRLVLERQGVRYDCTAAIAPNPDGHERIRRLLGERYGWADCWIALVADTHTSLGIRLSCA